MVWLRKGSQQLADPVPIEDVLVCVSSPRRLNHHLVRNMSQEKVLEHPDWILVLSDYGGNSLAHMPREPLYITMWTQDAQGTVLATACLRMDSLGAAADLCHDNRTSAIVGRVSFARGSDPGVVRMSLKPANGRVMFNTSELED